MAKRAGSTVVEAKGSHAIYFSQPDFSQPDAVAALIEQAVSKDNGSSAAGVRIIGTAGTDDLPFVHNLGANTVIDYRTQHFEEEIRDADAVIDLVGGETQARSFQVLRRGGKLISTVSSPDQHLAQSHGVDAAFFLVDRIWRRSLASSMVDS